jgi:hypothetical protein
MRAVLQAQINKTDRNDARCRSDRSRPIDTWSTSVQIPRRLTWIHPAAPGEQYLKTMINSASGFV